MTPARLIFETALHRNPETQEIESYWEDRWSLDLLIDEAVAQGGPFFEASYMNNPSALGGNALKVDWLHLYTVAELHAARIAEGLDPFIEHGPIYVGIDPAHGGQGSDPDYMACFALEILQNRGFAIDFYYGRHKVEDQAKFAESFMDNNVPQLAIIEETAARGFAFVSLTTQINDGAGTKHTVDVRKPQSVMQGAKIQRLIAASARWQNAQIRLPGVDRGDGVLVVDSRWNPFVNQWRTFPASHDDILDAAYWAQFEAFQTVIARGVTKNPLDEIDVERARRLMNNPTFRAQLPPGTTLEQVLKMPQFSQPARDRRGGILKPIAASRPRTRIRWRQ